MDPINVCQARIRLSELIDRAAVGEEVVIARRGRPVAKLLAYAPPAGRRRKLGTLKGKVRMSRDFNAPLSDEFALVSNKSRGKG